MSNTRLRAEFNLKFSKFSLYAIEIKKINFIVTEFIRSAKEQNKRFKNKKSLCDGYKKISYHQKSRAKDVVILDDNGKLVWEHVPKYDVLAEIWKALGGRWGGDWYKEGKISAKEFLWAYQWIIENVIK